MDDTEYHFADCTLHATRRELRRGGVLQAIEPKPFDLLHYLLRHRHRVVPHAELLGALWPGEVVTPGALARAVMLARRAAGDAREGRLIRTVARVGYRFVGELPPPQPAPGRPLALALLPFENRTGDDQHDWIELGLMSLVARALGDDPRLAVASVANVLSALDHLPRDAAPRERADTLKRLLGVRQVLAASVVREGAQLALQAGRIGADDAPLATVVVRDAGTLAAVAPGFARSLAEAVLPPGAHSAAPAVPSADPLAGEALARALQAAAEHNWSKAAHLLRVVRDLAPDSEAVQLELLRAQAALGDHHIDALAQPLLLEARARGDDRQEARIEQALGRNRLNLRDDARALAHLTRALALAAGQESADWSIQTLLWQCAAAIGLAQWVPATAALDEAEGLCQRNGNQIHALAGLNLRSVVAAHRGDLRQAAELSREVRRRSRPLRQHRYFVDASGNLAEDCIALGLLHEAAESAEEGLAEAAAVADRYHLGAMCAVLCLACAQLRQPEAAGRALARVEPLALPSDELGLLCARGHHAAAAGDFGAAADRLGAAVAALRERAGGLLAIETLPWWWLYSARAGRLDLVAQELADAGGTDAGPLFDAARRYAGAALTHARGDTPHARGQLNAVSALGMGPWSALARMDAAWLAIEAGDLAAARAGLDGLGDWLHEHPVAQAVQARWHLAAGDASAAMVFHRRYLAAATGHAAAPLADLGRCYERAGAGPTPQVPLAPWLVCLW